MFANSGTWAAVHLSRNGYQFHRIVHFREVQKMQTVFDTVQAQRTYLQLQDKELHCESDKERIVQEGHWRKTFVTLWTTVGATHIKKCASSSIHFAAWAENASHIHTQLQILERGSDGVFRRDSGISRAP